MRKALSTTAVAHMLGVAVGSVANWIDQGRLKAGKTPGGHRRIEAGDLIEFLRRHGFPIPHELTRRASVRVLVVDDEEAVATWVASEIKNHCPDYEVHTALSGFAAGEIVGSLCPDVVILDLRMPGMDGYEVCRRIKSNEKTRHIVVIAMTAEPTAQAEQRIRDCGAQTFLPKPLDRDALLRELAAATDGEE